MQKQCAQAVSSHRRNKDVAMPFLIITNLSTPPHHIIKTWQRFTGTPSEALNVFKGPKHAFWKLNGCRWAGCKFKDHKIPFLLHCNLYLSQPLKNGGKKTEVVNRSTNMSKHKAHLHLRMVTCENLSSSPLN
jgi:hypothetical protein